MRAKVLTGLYVLATTFGIVSASVAADVTHIVQFDSLSSSSSANVAIDGSVLLAGDSTLKLRWGPILGTPQPTPTFAISSPHEAASFSGSRNVVGYGGGTMQLSLPAADSLHPLVQQHPNLAGSLLGASVPALSTLDGFGFNIFTADVESELDQTLTVSGGIRLGDGPGGPGDPTGGIFLPYEADVPFRISAQLSVYINLLSLRFEQTGAAAISPGISSNPNSSMGSPQTTYDLQSSGNWIANFLISPSLVLWVEADYVGGSAAHDFEFGLDTEFETVVIPGMLPSQLLLTDLEPGVSSEPRDLFASLQHSGVDLPAFVIDTVGNSGRELIDLEEILLPIGGILGDVPANASLDSDFRWSLSATYDVKDYAATLNDVNVPNVLVPEPSTAVLLISAVALAWIVLPRAKRRR